MIVIKKVTKFDENDYKLYGPKVAYRRSTNSLSQTTAPIMISKYEGVCDECGKIFSKGTKIVANMVTHKTYHYPRSTCGT